MKLQFTVQAAVLTVSLCARIIGADDAPSSLQAGAPVNRPNSETVGVRISKLTRNADGTLLAIFDTKDKQGNTIPREVLITPETIVNIGGKLKKSSDITDDMI